MRLTTAFFFVISLLLCASVKGQGIQSPSLTQQNVLWGSRPSWNCGYVLLDDSSQLATGMRTEAPRQNTPPLFQIHGNIYYDYYYRSNIDTPYVLNDYQQHTIRTYLDITYKDAYPVRLAFTARLNNAGFLKNMAGINLGFNSHQFQDNVKKKVLDWLAARQVKSHKLQNLEDEIAKKVRNYRHSICFFIPSLPSRKSLKNENGPGSLRTAAHQEVCTL